LSERSTVSGGLALDPVSRGPSASAHGVGGKVTFHLVTFQVCFHLGTAITSVVLLGNGFSLPASHWTNLSLSFLFGQRETVTTAQCSTGLWEDQVNSHPGNLHGKTPARGPLLSTPFPKGPPHSSLSGTSHSPLSSHHCWPAVALCSPPQRPCTQTPCPGPQQPLAPGNFHPLCPVRLARHRTNSVKCLHGDISRVAPRDRRLSKLFKCCSLLTTCAGRALTRHGLPHSPGRLKSKTKLSQG
jgi:hypothetical protein